MTSSTAQRVDLTRSPPNADAVPHRGEIDDRRHARILQQHARGGERDLLSGAGLTSHQASALYASDRRTGRPAERRSREDLRESTAAGQPAAARPFGAGRLNTRRSRRRPRGVHEELGNHRSMITRVLAVCRRGRPAPIARNASFGEARRSAAGATSAGRAGGSEDRPSMKGMATLELQKRKGNSAPHPPSRLASPLGSFRRMSATVTRPTGGQGARTTGVSQQPVYRDDRGES